MSGQGNQPVAAAGVIDWPDGDQGDQTSTAANKRLVDYCGVAIEETRVPKNGYTGTRERTKGTKGARHSSLVPFCSLIMAAEVGQ